MPTFCALAGYVPEKDLKWDGQNIWPQLSGAEPLKPRTIYITGPGFRSRALRDADWKLVITQGAGKKAAETVELFDLAGDPNETTDLSAKWPDIVTRLHAKLEQIANADRDAEAND
jgi:arylsulfatase A-like enzyme